MAIRKSLAALLVASVLMPPGVHAVTIVECVDEDGNRTFANRCPPGFTEAAKRDVSTGAKSKPEPQPVVLYTVEACPVCDLVRLELEQRDIPFTEKQATTVEVQEEIKALSGELMLPVTKIGDAHLVGFDESRMRQMLEDAGHGEDADSS